MVQCIEILYQVNGMQVTVSCIPPLSGEKDSSGAAVFGAVDWQKIAQIAACITGCIASVGGKQVTAAAPTPATAAK